MPQTISAENRCEGGLSVDAGQTGVRLRLVSTNGAAVTEHPGIRSDESVLAQLAARISTTCDVERWQPVTLRIGTTGLEAADTDAAALLESLRSSLHGPALGSVRSLYLAHDSVTSYLAALGTRAGAVIAAGTGVVVLASGGSGVARVDGWGHLLGDAGSAFWLGRSGLDAALRAYDGRGRSTLLSTAARRRFGDPEELPGYFQRAEDRVSLIASFARDVSSCAEAGDIPAQGILEAGARELARSVAVALRTAGTEEPAAVSWAGTLLGHAHLYRGLLAGELARIFPRCTLEEPAGVSLDGVDALSAVPHAHPLASRIRVAIAPSQP